MDSEFCENDREDTVLDCIKIGAVNLLDYYLKSGYHVDNPSYIRCALQHGKSKIVKYLIENGYTSNEEVHKLNEELRKN